MHRAVLFLLLCLLAPASRSDVPVPEAEWMSQARNLLRDGFHPQAEKMARQLLDSNPGDKVRAEALLLLARARYEQRDAAEALRLLTERTPGVTNGLVHAYNYWTARLHFEANRPAEAAEAAGDPLLLPELDSNRIALARLKARALVQLGRMEEASSLLERTGAEEKSSADEVEGLLDLAAIYHALKRHAEEEQLLSRIAAHPRASDARDEARLWLASRRLDRGDAAAAESTLAPLKSTNTASRAVASRAWAIQAAIHERRGQVDRALQALETRETLLQGRQDLARSRLDRAQLLIKSGRLAEGAALLKREIGSVSREARAARAQLFLAQAALEEGLFPEAERHFQEYIQSFEDPAGLEQARLGRGWALHEQQRHAEAALAFEKLAADARDPAVREQAALKAGDAHFAAAQYAEARRAYRAYAQVFPLGVHASQAAFQAAMCLHRAGDDTGALAEWRALAERLPDDPMAFRALLQSAYVLEEREEWPRAREVLDLLLARPLATAEFPEALLQRGVVRYRLGELEGALADFEQVAERFPGNSAAENAYFMKGWCLYLMGRDAEALQICESFLQKYPRSPSAGDVLFWMAEYHYNRQAYARAVPYFEQAAQRFGKPAQVERALFWAGKASAQNKQYSEAIRFFAKVLEANPQTARRADLLFQQADCLTQQGQFAAALVLFDEIVRNHSNTYIALLAWGRKGDCLFTLGEQDATRFEQALLAYQGILDSPDAPGELRLQAGYKIARTYRRLGQNDKSLEHYLKVVYAFLEERTRVGPECEVWFSRSGMEAAELLESRSEWRQAIALYRRLEEASVGVSRDAAARMQKIRVEQLILF